VAKHQDPKKICQNQQEGFLLHRVSSLDEICCHGKSAGARWQTVFVRAIRDFKICLFPQVTSSKWPSSQTAPNLQTLFCNMRIISAIFEGEGKPWVWQVTSRCRRGLQPGPPETTYPAREYKAPSVCRLNRTVKNFFENYFCYHIGWPDSFDTHRPGSQGLTASYGVV